jgi:hypothetical protein
MHFQLMTIQVIPSDFAYNILLQQDGDKGMPIRKLVIVFCILILPTALYAAKTNEQLFNEHDYYLLQHYRLIYTDEIFEFCTDEHGTIGNKMRSCMIRNDKLKKIILSDALDELGRQSLAQRIYDDCVDYYPMNGVARIGDCVETRLDLAGKLKDDTIEKIIYQKCDFKWRKHGFRSIDSCSSAEARYYRDKGQLKD